MNIRRHTHTKHLKAFMAQMIGVIQIVYNQIFILHENQQIHVASIIVYASGGKYMSRALKTAFHPEIICQSHHHQQLYFG